MIEPLLLYGLAKGGTASGADLPANAWDNMAPPSKDFTDERDATRKLYGDAFNRYDAWKPTAKAATVAATPMVRSDAAARGYQQGNASHLAAIAAGKTLGAGANAYNKNLAAGMNANNAMAVTRTQGNALAGSMRTLGNTNQGMAVGGQSTLNAIKAQEQIAADNALNNQLGGMRAQDMGIASEAAKMQAAQNMANAGFANQTAIENQMAGLYNDAWKQKALAAGAGFDQQSWENDMAKAKYARGDAMYDDALQWRNQARQDAVAGQTFQTMGDMYGAAFRYNQGSKY
jgi:hypothetical protein